MNRSDQLKAIMNHGIHPQLNLIAAQSINHHNSLWLFCCRTANAVNIHQHKFKMWKSNGQPNGRGLSIRHYEQINRFYSCDLIQSNFHQNQMFFTWQTLKMTSGCCILFKAEFPVFVKIPNASFHLFLIEAIWF